MFCGDSQEHGLLPTRRSRSASRILDNQSVWRDGSLYCPVDVSR